MRVSVLLLSLFAVVVPPARAAESVRLEVPQIVSPSAIARHVQILADDRMQGRAPGGEGERPATDHIIAAFTAAGLQPAFAKGWRQPVRVVRVEPTGGDIAVRRGGGEERLGISGGAIVVTGGGRASASVAAADAVFVGYGISAPELGHDDFAGADLNGKVAVMLSGVPGGKDSRFTGPLIERYQPRADKFRRAVERGAVGVVLIYADASPSARWDAVRQGYLLPAHMLAEAAQAREPAAIAALPADIAADLFGGDERVARWQRDADVPGFRPQALDVAISLDATADRQTIETSNVVGLLAGSDPTSRAHMLYVAHWDHVGRCGADADADRICNGAVDNASGTGMLLEIARAAALGPRPPHAMVFLAAGAEEMGLLGSYQYTRSPALPLAEARLVLGMDSALVRPAGTNIVVLGEGLTTVDAWVAAGATAQGRALEPAPAVQGFYQRSDHLAFAEAGVPALVVTSVFAAPPRGGPDLTQLYFSQRYHRASDDYRDDLPFDGAAQDADLLLALGRAVADGRLIPAWRPSSPYQRAAAR